jgi:hypothetical protein
LLRINYTNTGNIQTARQFTAALLLTTTQSDNTLLHKAMQANNLIIFKKIFDFIRGTLANKLISLPSFSHNMLSINNKQMTLLHTAIQTGSLEILTLYFAEIKLLYKNQVITRTQFAEQLLTPSELTITTLSSAVSSKKPAILEFFLQELEIALNKEILTPDTYFHLFSKKNVLSTALQINVITPFHLLIDAILKAKAKRIFSEQDYIDLLSNNNATSSMIDFAIQSGNAYNLHCYFQYLRESSLYPESQQAIFKNLKNSIQTNDLKIFKICFVEFLNVSKLIQSTIYQQLEQPLDTYYNTLLHVIAATGNVKLLGIYIQHLISAIGADNALLSLRSQVKIVNSLGLTPSFDNGELTYAVNHCLYYLKPSLVQINLHPLNAIEMIVAGTSKPTQPNLWPVSNSPLFHYRFFLPPMDKKSLQPASPTLSRPRL